MTEDRDPLALDAPRPADDRLEELSRKLDTVAGAMAAVAASQNDLLDQSRQILGALEASAQVQRRDLEAVVDALTATVDAVEGTAAHHDDRLGGLRDAVTVPLADLQALLAARTERIEVLLQAMASRLDAAPGATPHGGDEPDRADPEGDLGAELDELRTAVRSLARQLPVLAQDLTAIRAQLDRADAVAASAKDLADEVRHHTDVALAGTIRVLDERFEGLRSAVAPAAAAAPAGMGFEAGAVMGAVQAAWSRLEQRLDQEFDQLGHQLVEMDRRIEQAITSAEAAANRPVVTGEQLRKTASSMKEAVQSAREQRRLRRGGTPPKGLGPG